MSHLNKKPKCVENIGYKYWKIHGQYKKAQHRTTNEEQRIRIEKKAQLRADVIRLKEIVLTGQSHENIRMWAVLFFKSLHELNPETLKSVLYDQISKIVGYEAITVKRWVHKWDVQVDVFTSV